MPPLGYRKHASNICLIEGCWSRSKYKGMCGMHYKRQWRHGDAGIVVKPINFERKRCTVTDCNHLNYASNTDYCYTHYLRLRRYGRLNLIKREYGTGSDHINDGGYKVISVGSVTKYEHIYFAELALGKPLPKGAIVHHVNGNKADNDTPFNLVICPDQSYHMLLHKRARDLGYSSGF